MAEIPFVTVIIPVLNDTKRLKLCLSALEQQSYPHSHYEVIVVDNAVEPAAEISAAVELQRAIGVHEPQPGSYAARNRGIALAKGEVIAFTDADCIPRADWLEQGVRVLQQTPNCGLVAGRIEIFFEADPVTPVALFEQLTAFPQQRLLEEYQGAATANVFTWKRVIEQVGLFNANLKARGDLEWGKRVFQAGYSQIYADQVCVAHPARSSYRDLYRRTVRLAGGIYDLQRSQHSFLRQNILFVQEFFKTLVPPLMFIWNLFRDERLPGLKQKITVSGVMVMVRYISAWELVRLKLGGISTRE